MTKTVTSYILRKIRFEQAHIFGQTFDVEDAKFEEAIVMQNLTPLFLCHI